MRAIVQDRFGPPSDTLTLRDIAVPDIGPGHVLVEVRAAAVNPADWHYITGTPWLVRSSAGVRRPKRPVPGIDLAGRVVAIADDVDDVRIGDDVFGGAAGSFAEYATVAADRLAPKPSDITFADAAAVPVAAITALQGLRDKADVQPGQHVVINGAAGGVGTFAVQIAKLLDAEVTAVCSTRNVELVRSLGADHVVDYTRDDFAALGAHFDVAIDNVGNRPPSTYLDVLRPAGVYVVIGGPKRGRVLGPMSHMARAFARFAVASQRATSFIAQERRADLELLATWLDDGRIRPVIDRHYPLEEAAAALDHLAEGHARGKIILDV